MKNKNDNPKLNESEECIFDRFVQTDSVHSGNPKKHFELARKVYKTITQSGWKKNTRELESDNAKLDSAHNFYLGKLAERSPHNGERGIDVKSRLEGLAVKLDKKNKVMG